MNIIDYVADGLIERFKKLVEEAAKEPFDKLDVKLPARKIWLDYAKTAIDAVNKYNEENK